MVYNDEVYISGAYKFTIDLSKRTEAMETLRYIVALSNLFYTPGSSIPITRDFIFLVMKNNLVDDEGNRVKVWDYNKMTDLFDRNRFYSPNEI
ncbi:MAG: hypothetical protein ACFE94_01725 [Candidatus Hodarchaeota archaeon]